MWTEGRTFYSGSAGWQVEIFTIQESKAVIYALFFQFLYSKQRIHRPIHEFRAAMHGFVDYLYI